MIDNMCVCVCCIWPQFVIRIDPLTEKDLSVTQSASNCWTETLLPLSHPRARIVTIVRNRKPTSSPFEERRPSPWHLISTWCYDPRRFAWKVPYFDYKKHPIFQFLCQIDLQHRQRDVNKDAQTGESFHFPRYLNIKFPHHPPGHPLDRFWGGFFSLKPFVPSNPAGAVFSWYNTTTNLAFHFWEASKIKPIESSHGRHRSWTRAAFDGTRSPPIVQ